MTPRSMLALSLVSCLATACGMPMFKHAATDRLTPVDTFRVLTYNTLHGLEVGRFWVRRVESQEDRAVRFNLRIQQMTEAQPDLIFLQEVNPLPEMATEYVQALTRRGLHYSEVHQVDACGLRVAPGLALIPGLNNGLVILAKAPLQLRKLDGVKLSGGIGSCQDSWGIQFGEFRYALFAEVLAPTTETRYLVATMHLHSGVERDAHLLRELMEAHSQGRLQQYDKLMAVLVENHGRRLMELHNLLEVLQKFQARQEYAGVIFGGDMNFEPDSAEYRELEPSGFQDTHQLAMPARMLQTYDPRNNPLAGHEEKALPFELAQAIARESPDDQQEIVARYRKAITMSRRIDFLFSMSFMAKACLRQELFGQPRSMHGPTGSDHYGVLNTYSYGMERC